jgi:uncharacterized Rossmann fold enzyme
MEYDEWEPVYTSICADMGYPRSEDERARDVLDKMTAPFDESLLSSVSGASAVVAGAGPSLETPAALDRAAAGDVVVAASSAAATLEERGIAVDCMVTDLDKAPETVRTLTARGTPVAIHAHGDNVALLREHVPALTGTYVLPTTQAQPRGSVRNFGGFTDGDRAAFLADAFGAATLTFVGWDFDDPSLSAEKRAKLAWAERLLYWLEHRRDERFAVLDGRRVAIDTGPIPL